MTDPIGDRLLSEERKKSATRRTVIAGFRRGIGISLLVIFVAVSLLSALYLVKFHGTRDLIAPIVAITTASVAIALFHPVVGHLGGRFAQRLFGALVIAATAISIFLFR